MAPSVFTEDFYAILQVSPNATVDAIRRSYRQLAFICHPDKNPSKADATSSFQSLSNAYETLRDLEKRNEYDRQYPTIKQRLSTQEEAARSRAEAAEVGRKRAAEEALNKQKAQKASQERLRPLEQLKSTYESEISEITRTIRRLTADLKRLRDQDDEELRKEKERNSWWTYVTSFGNGSVEKTQDQKQRRESERLHRLASKSIKENDLSQKGSKLQNLRSELQTVIRKIAIEKAKFEHEAWAQEVKKQEELGKEQEGQERKRWVEYKARINRLQKEEAARAAATYQAREARLKREREEEAQERIRIARQTREAEARASEAAHDSRARAASSSNTTPASASHRKGTCRHQKFWPMLEGSYLCQECDTVQKRFAFQCPGCSMLACANCRQMLRNEKGSTKKRSRMPS